MATKTKQPPRLAVKLSVSQAKAFERLSPVIFLTAANMERDEKLLKSLVTKKLARMTRIGSSLGFIRDVADPHITVTGTPEEMEAYRNTLGPPVTPVKKATRSRKK